MAGPALVGLIMIAGAPQQQPSGNFEMAKFIMHMSWRVQGMPGATQQGPRQRARWIMNEPGPVLLSCWGQWLGTWGFQSVSVGN